MTLTELQENRYFIVLDALSKGLYIEYKPGWYLYIDHGKVYQTHYNRVLNKQTTHLSDITLQSFIEKLDSLKSSYLREIYGNIKLKILQDRLIKSNKEVYH